MTDPLRAVISGEARVYCVHNREKRVVMDETHVAALGLQVGQVYDPRQHKLHRCACCENLFVDLTDVPRYCGVCRGKLVHPLGGPLPKPLGEV
jgi:hypothetical protein